MDLGFLLTISCVLTAVLMTVFIGIILFFVRYGGQGVKMLFDRFLGGDDKNDEQIQIGQGQAERQAVVASSQSLRQRAQQLDFPAPGGAAPASAGFGAQSAGNSLDFPPQRASLTPRGQSADFNTQVSYGGQAQNFQLSTPSLSPSRPFQAGSQFSPNPAQQQQFGQQPLQGNQYSQQGGQSNQLGQPSLRPPQQQQQFGQQPLQGNQYSQQGGQPNQLGQPSLRPPQQQQQFGQQPLQGNQYSQQGGQPNQLGQQPGFNAQGFNQQAPPQQQGGLGQNRPPLRSVPRPGNTQYDRPIGRRDSRKGDDRDYIYDDGSRSSGGIIDDVGDFIDNF